MGRKPGECHVRETDRHLRPLPPYPQMWTHHSQPFSTICYATQHFLPTPPNQLTSNCFCSSRITHMVLQLFQNTQWVPRVFFFAIFFFNYFDCKALSQPDCDETQQHVRHTISPRCMKRAHRMQSIIPPVAEYFLPMICTHSKWHLFQHNLKKKKKVTTGNLVVYMSSECRQRCLYPVVTKIPKDACDLFRWFHLWHSQDQSPACHIFMFLIMLKKNVETCS